jgi:hypothetical protein
MKDGSITDNPWTTGLTPAHTLANFPSDVEAIAVIIAVVDPASRSLLSDQNMIDLIANMSDYRTQQGRGPVKTGDMEAQWNTVVTTNSAVVPQAANQAIRIYSRYFDLKTL